MKNKRINEVKSVTKKRGQLTIEFFDNTGKIRQKDTGLAPTQSNRTKLWKKIVPEFEARLREQQKTEKERTYKTLSEYANILLELSENQAKIEMIKGHIRRFLIYFGEDVYPKDIKMTTIKQFFANLKKRDGTPLVRATKKQWRQTLKSIFQLAYEDGEIERNIVSEWQLPRQDDPPKTVKPFSSDDIKKLLSHSKGSLHNYIGIGIHTGMRPEELIALKIDDIDFKNGLISIQRAFARLSKNKHTKTKKSIRKIPIFDDAIPFLEAQISYAKSKKSTYLFCKNDGTPPKSSDDITGHAQYIDKHGKLHHNDGPWHKLRKKVGLPGAKIHWTRHTFAVHALKSKLFSPQEVAGIMGINLTTLLGHYAKYIGEDHQTVDRSIKLFSA